MDVPLGGVHFARTYCRESHEPGEQTLIVKCKEQECMYATETAYAVVGTRVAGVDGRCGRRGGDDGGRTGGGSGEVREGLSTSGRLGGPRHDGREGEGEDSGGSDHGCRKMAVTPLTSHNIYVRTSSYICFRRRSQKQITATFALRLIVLTHGEIDRLCAGLSRGLRLERCSNTSNTISTS